MTSAAIGQPILPTDELTKQIEELLEVTADPARGRAYVTGPSGEAVEVPERLYSLLLQAIRELKAGRTVQIVSSERELTTQQAADLLNVSRPHLIRLLEEGKIPYRMVGTHRRLALKDVLSFPAERSKRRRQLFRQMAQEAEEAGLYEE